MLSKKMCHTNKNKWMSENIERIIVKQICKLIFREIIIHELKPKFLIIVIIPSSIILLHLLSICIIKHYSIILFCLFESLNNEAEPTNLSIVFKFA